LDVIQADEMAQLMFKEPYPGRATAGSVAVEIVLPGVDENLASDVVALAVRLGDPPSCCLGRLAWI